jgi:transposase
VIRALAPWDNPVVTSAPENPADDIAALKAALAAERTAREEAEARACGAEAMVAHLKLVIAKLRREQYGQSAERGCKLLDQLELQLEEAAASAAEDEAAAAPAAGTTVGAFTRRKPVRAPFPSHLPRERVMVPAPTACPCCGGKLAKLGETITETLEIVPRQWKVIQTVREKFTCRACEKITQPPAPFHTIPRGHVGPSLLAMILYAKYGEHQPLNRQSESYAREGVDLDVSTLADHVGAAIAVLSPLTGLSAGMYSMPTACTATTRRCRCWPRARRSPAGCGLMCATTDRLLDPTRRPPCSFILATAAASIPPGTWLVMPASCRPMLMLGSAIYTTANANPARLLRRRAGATAAATSLSKPICARRRWRSRRFGASTRSSPSRSM